MNKRLGFLFCFITITFGLVSCIAEDLASTDPIDTIAPTIGLPIDTIVPTSTKTQSSTPTTLPPTLTFTPLPTNTSTPTVYPTLEIDQADEAIRFLFQEPDSCSVPCFWNIKLGQTTMQETRDYLSYLRLFPKLVTSLDEIYYYEVVHETSSGLSFSINFAVENSVVENVRVSIFPEIAEARVPREWLGYSPETLIAQYGVPTKVEFFVDKGAPTITYAIVMYFNSQDLIIEYYGDDLLVESGYFLVCPVTNEFDLVSVWIGENPKYPPGEGYPLEETTSLSLDEFAELIIGYRQKACIKLRSEAFP